MNRSYYNLGHYIRHLSRGELKKVSKRINFPKDSKDEMTIYIHSRGLPPEWVYEIDDLFSDYWLQKAV